MNMDKLGLPDVGKTTTKRYTQNAIFRGGPETWLNACVGLNGGPKELDEYADGFFQGGFAIVRAAEAREAPVDILIYPAVFAFRHGIELYVKHLLTRFQTLNNSAEGYAATHKLTDNWALLVAAVKKARMGELPADKVGMAESFIKDFCEVDPRGDAFRYPEDRLGKPTLSDVSLVNILVLRDGMLLLHGFLADWSYYMEEMLRNAWEDRD
jgi:hypothetical protein